MSQSEYDFWSPRSRREYAADKARANKLTKSESELVAVSDFNRLLPDGLKTKDSFLYSVKNGEQIVGFTWFVIRGAQDNRKAFICDIIVEEELRGKGYGRSTMLLVEQEAKKLGLKQIGLHVFAFNERAVGLYQSLGYLTTDLTMEKSLS